MKLSLVFVALLGSGLVGCRDNVVSVPPVDTKAREQAQQVTSDKAWLNQHLPANTTLYARLPSLWGALAAPKNRPLDAARAHPAHLKAVSELRQAWSQDPVWKQLQLPTLAELYLHDLASPLEFVLISPGRMLSPASQGLLSARLKLNAADFATRFEQVVKQQAVIVKTALNAEGFAHLQLGNLQAALHFTESTGRLQLLIGMAANIEQLQQLEAAPPAPELSLVQAEQRLDDSGQGELLWLDAASLVPMAQMATENLMLKAWLGSIKSVSVGRGSHKNRGKMAWWVEAPQAPWLKFLPHQPKTLSLKTVGQPEWVAQWSLPSQQESELLLQSLNQLATEYPDWQKLKPSSQTAEPKAEPAQLSPQQQLQQYLGFEPTLLFEALGPEMIAFSDKAGDFVAVKLRQPKRFEQLLQQWVKQRGFKLETLKRNGHSFYHLSASLLELEPAKSGQQLDPFKQLFNRVQGHYYWLQEEDHLIFAAVPQSLRDRLNQAERVALGPWLQQQGLEPQHSLASVAVRGRYLQRNSYYGYLRLLSVLADLSGKPLDLLSLPSARELQLADESSLGLQLEASEAGLGLSLSYADSPIELIGSNATTFIALSGVAAAIALPAYQDYTIRSKVNRASQQLYPVQYELGLYFDKHRRLPEELTETAVDPQDLRHEAAKAQLQYRDKQLWLQFDSTAESALAGKAVVMLPYLDAEGALQWRCANNPLPVDAKPLTPDLDPQTLLVEDKYLPSHCR